MSDSPHIADRMADIQPFHVMDLLARARQLEARGRSIVHLEIGEPDFATPEPIIQAGIEALREQRTHYTPAVGLTALREAIAGHYRDRFGVDLDARRIIVTPGASGALQLALSVLVNPGEAVLMADPGYPCNRHFVRLLEGRSRAVNVSSDTGYQLTPELLRQHWSDDTVAALVASPSNPTGTLVPRSDMQAMLDEAGRRNGIMIVDEIYQGLVYDDEAFTALQLSDDVFVINSFSKYFGMTGWRLGWMVAPDAWVDAVDRLAQNIFLAAPTVAQYAALQAFSEATLEILEQRREAFRQRRDYLLPALRELGFDIPVDPRGAFYIYANCSRFTEDSYRFVYQMLEQAGVAATPGIDFGSYRAEQHLRFAYTRSVDVLEQGVERMARYLGAVGA